MTATTHQLIALLAALWLLTLWPVSAGLLLGILAVMAVMIGALTPDLDQPAANIWRRMIGGGVAGDIFQFFSGGHRHFTHSLIGIAAIGYGMHWLGTHLINPAFTAQSLIIWRAFMVGYISHSVADTLTDRGVPWLWPLHWHLRVPPGPEQVRVTTASWVETVLVRGAVVAIAVILLLDHWPTLLAFFTMAA